MVGGARNECGLTMRRLVSGLAAAMMILSLAACRYIKLEPLAEIYTQIEQTTAEISTTREQTTAKKPHRSEITARSEVFTESISIYIPETTNAVESRYEAFYHNDGETVYVLAEEYYTICGVVMNETGYGSYEGCIAVAQAIRNQIIREKRLGHDYDIESVQSTYGLHYTKKPNDLVRRAVTDVFYNHIVVTDEPIIAWCSGYSSWHSSQIEVCSYDGNTFYKLRGD